MKLHKSLIDKYQKCCPTSYNKCDSHSEIEYKIIRAAKLGKLIDIKGNILTVGYYDLRFVVSNNTVIDLYKVDHKHEIYIKESNKVKYDEIHNMVMV